MYLQKIIPFVLGALFMVSCNTNAQKTTEEVSETTAKAASELYFGEKIDADGAIPFAQLTSKMGDSDSLQVKVVGTIEEVCQKKGCWITMVNQENPESEELFVKFKDYAFFMPLDAAGQEIIMDGYAFREVTSVDELRHYAEDAKEPQEVIDAITEHKVELKFMASGVILKNEVTKN